MSESEEEIDLKDAIVAEFEWGRRWLESEGHAGAELIVCPPDQHGARMYELGARFAAQPGRSSHAVVEVDPHRVGWRVEASLSICPDDEDSCHSIDLGAARATTTEDAKSWALVLTRRAVVDLRTYLDNPGNPRTKLGRTPPHEGATKRGLVERLRGR